MTHPLTLVRVTRPAPVVSAGWLASPDPVEWLREVAHCRKQGVDLALYPVARSASDPRAAGVLLIPRGKVPSFRPRVQELIELLPGVHAPADAALSAGLPPNERSYFFPYALHFFHPSLGLIGFDPKDELAPANLLEAPPERAAYWNHAVPAGRFAPELKVILVADPPDPQAMLDEAAQEIGDRKDQPKPGSALMDKASMLGLGLAGGAMLGAGWILGSLGKAGGLLGGGPGPGSGRHPGGPGAFDRLREWAEKHWQQLADSRNREIERLMKLMETNPDEGLRYALPLAGIEQSRGTAQPSWKLGLNSTRFSLGHGGGAIDGWDIAGDARLKLERQYREAAKREVALGRHERAAYIYGNLLGDWASAAKALADAGRHQDAVAIYLHKLNNRAAAAKCLEDAGLLLQAAAAYAEAKQFEKSGDLHAKLGNHAEAREMWLAELEAQRDPLVKARLLSTKLDDRPSALVVLDETWKSGNRSEAALLAMFTIHREDDNAVAGAALLDTMFEHRSSALPLEAKLRIAHDEAKRWKGAELWPALEKQAFRRIGAALATGSGNSKALLDFLPKLDPDDLLLERDAKRYSIHKNPPPIPKSGPPAGNLKPEQIITISSHLRWDSIAPLPKGVSIAGYGQEMLAVGQLRENGCHTSALRTQDDPGDSPVRHLTVTSARGTGRLFHFTKFGRLHYRALDRMRNSGDDALGTLRGILAAGPFGDEGDFALLQYTATSSLCVHIYSEMAELRRTIPIDLAPPDVTGLDWHIAGRGGHLCIAAAGFVAWRFPDGQFSTMQLGQSPSSLQISPRNGTLEALVSVGSEVLVIDFPKAGKDPEPVNLFSNPTNYAPPASCYLPDGSIVIAHRGGGSVFAPGGRLKENATLSFPRDAEDPVAVCSRGNGGFAILTDGGKLVVFGK
jgi:tetratricopeptide (TPR) repeat protein